MLIFACDARTLQLCRHLHRENYSEVFLPSNVSGIGTTTEFSIQFRADIFCLATEKGGCFVFNLTSFNYLYGFCKFSEKRQRPFQSCNETLDTCLAHLDTHMERYYLRKIQELKPRFHECLQHI